MLYILLGILSGVSIVVSRIVNSSLAEKTDIYHSTICNYITGLVTSILLFVFLRESFGNFILLKEIPFSKSYVLFGGFAGVALVLLSNIVTSKLSAFTMTLLVFLSQYLTGMLLDFLLFKTFAVSKIVGGLFLAAGLYLYQQPDKQTK